jgi:GT2 family glycosyltransferase
MPKDQRKISVLITNLRSIQYLEENLMSFVKEPVYEILVLELDEEKVEPVAKKLGLKNVRVFRKPTPFYFAQSYNFLASQAKGNILLFLNSDVIPQEHMVENMSRGFKYFDILGCKLVYPDKDDRPSTNPNVLGTIQHAGMWWESKYPVDMNMPTHIGLFQNKDVEEFSRVYEVKGVTGAAMMMKKKTWDKIGGFDEKFKNCYEDVDLCIRATDLGFKIGYIGQAVGVHYVSGAGGTDGKFRTSAQFLDESRTYFVQKYYKDETPQKEYPSGYDKIPLDWAWKRPQTSTFHDMGNSKLLVSDSPNFRYRVLIGTPTIGNIRMEWALARFGQVIPMNWSSVQIAEYLMSTYAPMNYTVPDAQNLIVKQALEGDFEWLILIEDDTCPKSDVFLRFNTYMRERKVPIVSGLYYCKADPSEPLVFRGRGNGVFWNWKAGDLVWADGVPTGCLLIHTSILKALADISPTYQIKGQTVKRVFQVPESVEFSQELGVVKTLSGTSDLDFCTRVMEEKIFEKAGWGAYQKMKYPFLVDTNIFCTHIDQHGNIYPPQARGLTM